MNSAACISFQLPRHPGFLRHWSNYAVLVSSKSLRRQCQEQPCISACIPASQHFTVWEQAGASTGQGQRLTWLILLGGRSLPTGDCRMPWLARWGNSCPEVPRAVGLVSEEPGQGATHRFPQMKARMMTEDPSRVQRCPWNGR